MVYHHEYCGLVSVVLRHYFIIVGRIATLLYLTACGADYARMARIWAPGHRLTELEACMGIPDRMLKQDDGTQIAEWTTTETNATLATLPGALLETIPAVQSLALPAASLSGSMPIVAGGNCRAMATVDAHGVVTGLRYAGAGDGISGANALCGVGIVRGCMRP